MPHAQDTTRSGAVGKLVGAATSIQELSAAAKVKVKEWNASTLLERDTRVMAAFVSNQDGNETVHASYYGQLSKNNNAIEILKRLVE